jgi:hypothetical protein
MDLKGEKMEHNDNKLKEKKDQSLAAWDSVMSLVNNRFFLYDMGKLFFFTYLITAVLSLLISVFSGNMKSFPFLLKMFFCIAAAITVLGLLIALVLFGNKYAMRFELTEKHISWEGRSRIGRIAGPLAFILGLLARKPSVAGAGMLAAANNSGKMSWSEVRRIKEYPALGVITLMNSWRVVARLFCTPDNYRTVAEIVRSHAKNLK